MFEDRRRRAARRAVSLTIDGRTGVDRWLGVVTDIVVRGETIVPRYVSGLTIPEIVWDHSPLQGRMEFVFRYERGAARSRHRGERRVRTLAMMSGEGDSDGGDDSTRAAS